MYYIYIYIHVYVSILHGNMEDLLRWIRIGLTIITDSNMLLRIIIDNNRLLIAEL